MAAVRTKTKGRWSQQPSTPAQNKRGPWSNSEDEQLRALVAEKGSGKWVQISDALKTRTPKQCRERWHQNLKPDLNHEPITEEEGRVIERMVQQMGKKWADIARHLHNRSDNAVKNWWNGGENRRKREQARAAEAAQAHAYHSHTMGPTIYYPQNTQPIVLNGIRLPPIRNIPPPLTVNESRRVIDPAEPSPLSARPPSLVSDAGTELSVHPGSFHSHRPSFNLPGAQYSTQVNMHRTPSNETYWASSPTDRPHHLYRPSFNEEHNPVYRTNIIHEKRALPSLENLTSGPYQQPEEVSPTDCRAVVGVPRAPSGSLSPPALSSEQTKLPPCSEIERPSSGSAERNKMSVNMLCD